MANTKVVGNRSAFESYGQLLSIGTSFPKIATHFKSFYLAEIFTLLLRNLSWWLPLPLLRFSHIFIIFCRVLLEICDSSFFKLSKIRAFLANWFQNLLQREYQNLDVYKTCKLYFFRNSFPKRIWYHEYFMIYLEYFPISRFIFL